MATEEEVSADISSVCLRNIQVNVVMTVTNVTIETIRVAVKINRLRVKEVNNMNFLRRNIVFPKL